jgi:hypothetical protein
MSFGIEFIRIDMHSIYVTIYNVRYARVSIPPYPVSLLAGVAQVLPTEASHAVTCYELSMTQKPNGTIRLSCLWRNDYTAVDWTSGEYCTAIG